MFQRKAFVVFRGTESSNDWAINRSDALTHTLADSADRRVRQLRDRYGDLLDKLGDPTPGRHAGFSIAWASIKDLAQIEGSKNALAIPTGVEPVFSD